MNDIEKALKALAEVDAQAEASLKLESRVRELYRHRLKPVSRRAVWHRLQPVIALAAAAAIAIAIFVWRHPHPQSIATLTPAVTVESPKIEPALAVTPVNARPVPKRTPRREIVTDFFPLMDAPPPVDRGELLRVTVPAAAMRNVGLPVAEDRLSDPVQADVLVSEEGLATAIRFVRYE